MIAQHSFFSTAIAAVLMLTGLTSCGDIEQNLVLKADGSGTLETTFDVGELMSMTKGMGEISSLTNEDVTISGGQPADTSLTTKEEAKDPMQLIIDKVTNPEYDLDFDTLISFVDIMPDSVKAKQTNLDLLKKINIRLKSPARSTSLKMGLVMDFKNEAELDEMIKYVETFDDSSSTAIIPSMGGGGMQSETFLDFEADMKAGWIRFDTVDYSGLGLEMGMSGDSTMNGEEMGMVEMMFGNTKLKSTIHVPGEVTSCTNKDAILTKDNKVIVEYSFLDVLKSGKLPGYTIYFTPKK